MVPFVRRWALDNGMVDVPDARKVHEDLIPRVGGIAVCMSFILSMLIYVGVTSQVRGILAGALILFCTGLADDLKGLTPKQKFLGEIAGCITAISVGKLYIQNLGNLFGTGTLTLPLWLASPLPCSPWSE